METAPQRKLFRQTALDRIASQEQLDRTVDPLPACCFWFSGAFLALSLLA